MYVKFCFRDGLKSTDRTQFVNFGDKSSYETIVRGAWTPHESALGPLLFCLI